MNSTKWLLPYRLKKWGWILTVPSFIIGIFFLITDGFDIDWLDTKVFAIIGEEKGDWFGDTGFFLFMENNLADELIAGSLMLGLMFLCFTREKFEDEYIAKIRWESMLWAVYTQMIVFIIALFTIYGIPFWTFMLVNMFLLPIFFVVRYYWKLFTLKREA